MATEQNKAEAQISFAPVYPKDFGAMQHRVNQFDANVSGQLTKKDLENPALWVNVARSMVMGSDIRVLAEDLSFVAHGIITYVSGSTAKVKIYSFKELDLVNYDEMSDIASDYEVKLRGTKKWCMIKKSTGEIVKDLMPTQADALKELSDYQKALRS